MYAVRKGGRMARIKIWFAAAVRIAKDYVLITAGSVIVAAGVDMFLTPNKVIASGATGIAMLGHFLWRWPIGTAVLLINIPLLLAGIKWGGGLRVLWRTIFAVVVMSVAIDLLTGVVPPVSGDPLIYTLFGGLVDGLGIGMVLRGRGTTGGTDIVAQLTHRYWRIPFGQVFLWSNTAILLLAIPVVGLVPVLYALIVNYISSRVIDTVQEGLSFARALMVISEEMDDIRQAILSEVGRGVTLLQGRGGYTEKPREVLYVVVARSQISRLKRIIGDIDPKAFVVITEANEVLGEGFHPVVEPD
jgi:uncharacterized membrane-anchored protein YitT (DUF2179 family)